MTTYMVFTYGTDIDKDVSVRIPYIPESPNPFAVDSAMQRIFVANALHPKHGSLVSKKKAVQYIIETTELDVK